MSLIQTITLSAVQGFTELLPISSTGHLIILGKALGIENLSNFALTSLHLGSTLAIIVFNFKFIFKDLFTKEKMRFYIILAIASIPAAIAGFLFNDLVETKFHTIPIIAASLIIVGIFMIILENNKRIKPRTNKLEDVTPVQSFAAGIGQTLALIPGTSRSGITTITGMLAGVDKYTAIRYSFILGLPVLLGSFVYEAAKTQGSIQVLTSTNTILGIIASFIVGYFSLWLLEKMSRTKFLTYFGIYRIILGIVLLLFFTL